MHNSIIILFSYSVHLSDSDSVIPDQRELLLLWNNHKVEEDEVNDLDKEVQRKINCEYPNMR